MSQNKNLALLQNNKLFAGLKESDVLIDLDQEGISYYKEGDIIYQSEENSNVLFMIIEGEVKIKIPKEEGSPTILRKNKGEYFGEMELLEKTPRRSSAVANRDCLIYKLKEDKLKELIVSNKKIEANLLNLNPYEKNSTDEKSTEQTEEKTEIINDDIQAAEPEDNNLPETDANTFNDIVPDSVNDREEIIAEEPTDSSNLENINLDDLSLPPINLDEMDQQLPEETITESPEENKDIYESQEKSEPENIADTEINQEEVKTEEIKPEETKSDVEWGFGESKENIETAYNETVNEADLDLPKETDFANDEKVLTIPEETKETSASEEAIEIHTPKSDKDLLLAIKDIYSDLELTDTLNSISDSLKQLINAGNVRIYLADNEKNELYSFTDGENEIKRISIGKGLVGYSAEHKEILNLSLPSDDIRYDSEVDENVNTLLFPIVNTDNSLIAVLGFAHVENGNFTKSDEDVLNSVSKHIASALTNALQYKSLLNRYQHDYLLKAANFIIEDVNTPLMLIKNYAEFIKRKSEIKEVGQISDFIIEQADLAINSNKAFHNFLTEENLIEPKAYQLNDILDDILDQLAEYVEIRKVKLFKRFETNTQVYLDKNNFYLACFQIAKNACDAMPDGGNIYLISKREDNLIQIEFKDTGKGISEEIKGKIFEPYFSYGKGQAAGLGLAVAQKIIKDHGGKIITGEGLGEGAVFIISLPVYEEASSKSV